MSKIGLFNRDLATLWLEKIRDIEDNISEWKLKVDKEHDYCLQYLRVIFDKVNGEDIIQAVDPSGGPFISLSDEFEEKYKIIKIIDPTTFLISERTKSN